MPEAEVSRNRYPSKKETTNLMMIDYYEQFPNNSGVFEDRKLGGSKSSWWFGVSLTIPFH